MLFEPEIRQGFQLPVPGWIFAGDKNTRAIPKEKARVSKVRGRCPLVWFENMRAFLRRYGSYGSEKNDPLQSERFNSILACGAQKRKRILVRTGVNYLFLEMLKVKTARKFINLFAA